jgi:hypothetical protein
MPARFFMECTMEEANRVVSNNRRWLTFKDRNVEIVASPTPPKEPGGERTAWIALDEIQDKSRGRPADEEVQAILYEWEDRFTFCPA